MNKPLFSLAIAFLSLSHLLCGLGAFDFDSDHFTKTKPEPAQLAGVYLPTADTWKLINETGHYNIQDTALIISADGTFEMTNMPDWWQTDFGESFGGTDSGQGKWSLSPQNDWWQIRLSFDLINFNSRPDLSGDYVTFCEISGEQPPYSFWFYVGDPDDGRRMIFQQTVEKP